MKKFFINLTFILICFVNIVFTQGDAVMDRKGEVCKYTQEDILSKISYGMTIKEVEDELGKPIRVEGSGLYIPIYKSSDGFFIRFTFMGDTLSRVSSVNGIDLLANEWKAEKADFDIYINNEIARANNPIVTISDKTYIPIKDLEEKLGLNILWNKSKYRVEITTKVNNDKLSSDESAEVKEYLSLKDFKFLRYDMNMSEIYETVGEPDYYTDSGIMWGVYKLSDGNELHLHNYMSEKLQAVSLKTPDRTRIFIDFDDNGLLKIN